MSSKGGYPAVPPRHVGERFYNQPGVRRHQEILLQQQMMQRQLLQQQYQQRQMQRRPMGRPESSSQAEARRRHDGDDSSAAAAAALYPPRPVGPGSSFNITNLDRLMESVTPYVQARNLPEVDARGRRTREVDSLPFFYLDDLWESFCELSVYGAGVPLMLNGRDRFQQYYVPYLSGIQLYIDPSKQSSRVSRLTNSAGSSDADGDRRTLPLFSLNVQQRLNRLSLGDKSAIGSVTSEYDIAKSPGIPSFQFLERERPHNRRPLSDKMSILASRYPQLRNCKSCDLLPASWICVAWYPIYRIPVGPTLENLDASFLSFHSLSTQPRLNCPPRYHAPNTRYDRGFIDQMARISIPCFALASYKLRGSIVSPSGPYECDQEFALLQAADNWLRCLNVLLPDFDFFRSHYPHNRR